MAAGKKHGKSAKANTPLRPGALLRDGLQKIARKHAGDVPAARLAALEKLREALEKGHKAAQAGLEEKRFRGGACAEKISRMMDEIIVEIAEFVQQVMMPAHSTAITQVSIVAVGGYGRGRLAPFSDIDLLFVVPMRETEQAEQFVEHLLYILWDLRLKVGHATRTVNECVQQARADMTIRTSMLESRLLCGGAALFADYREKFARRVRHGSPRAFVKAKLDERDLRHQRSGESRYLVEPNIKEGKGGLRDLNTLFWIAKYCYSVDEVTDLVDYGFLTRDELALFRRSENFLWAVRCHLHYLSGRAEERLSFDVQSGLAAAMGVKASGGQNAVERFMRQYFLAAKDVGDLTRIFCSKLEAEQNKPGRLARLPAAFRRQKQVHGFTIAGQRLKMVRADVFRRNPVNLIRMFKLANDYKLLIDPDTLRAVTNSLDLVDKDLRQHPEANSLFLDILTSRNHPERILRRMNEAGVLGKFLPDFGRIVALMQFNMYHHYTADEHLLRAIGIMAELERGELDDDYPLAHELVPKLNRKVIYLAVLLHDIAKGRPQDHSEAGARIARRLGPRLGLTEAETDLTEWLVKYHLVMSDTAQRRDLADPQTIEDFVDIVQTLERLRHLLVLTVVDIRAVGPGVWNGWKGQLLRELYLEAEGMLAGSASHSNRPHRVQLAQQAFLEAYQARHPDLSAAARKKALTRHHDAYWLSTGLQAQLAHADILNRLKKEPMVIDIQHHETRGVLELCLACQDHPGLFSRLTGACAVAGLNIVDARLITTRDGMALDVLQLQPPEQTGNLDQLDPPDYSRTERLKETIQKVLQGDILPPDRIAEPPRARRLNAFSLTPGVMIDNDLSSHSTVIEVSGLDRPGLLHALSRTLFVLNVSIVSARAVTFGERAVDVFYVQDLTGFKVTRQSQITAIEEKLREALSNPRQSARSLRQRTKAA